MMVVVFQSISKLVVLAAETVFTAFHAMVNLAEAVIRSLVDYRGWFSVVNALTRLC